MDMKMNNANPVLLFALIILSILITLTAAKAQTPGSDFEARCQAAGVVRCFAFDNTSTDIVQNVTLFPDGNGVFRGSLDTNIKASGAGALRFTVPPPPHSGANIAGQWSPGLIASRFPGFGRTFSQNSKFYLQFRQRFSPEMLNNSWDSSWKMAIIHYNQESCARVQLVTNNRYLSGLVTMYTDCGGRGLTTDLGGSQYRDTSPFLLQQGDYNCQYKNENSTDCFYLTPNEWLTFYYEVTVGTWDQPNSTIRAWVAREGATTYKQFINLTNFPLSCNTDPCDQLPGSAQGFNNITFTPYMTGLSTTSGDPVTAYTWYDELIVSTQPIAAPGGKASSPPRAPTGLSVK